jgi:hypothetical protein
MFYQCFINSDRYGGPKTPPNTLSEPQEQRFMRLATRQGFSFHVHTVPLPRALQQTSWTTVAVRNAGRWQVPSGIALTIATGTGGGNGGNGGNGLVFSVLRVCRPFSVPLETHRISYTTRLFFSVFRVCHPFLYHLNLIYHSTFFLCPSCLSPFSVPLETHRLFYTT